jgi:hypothetical protein
MAIPPVPNILLRNPPARRPATARQQHENRKKKPVDVNAPGAAMLVVHRYGGDGGGLKSSGGLGDGGSGGGGLGAGMRIRSVYVMSR